MSEEIDFNTIKIKVAGEYNPLYKRYVVMSDTIVFLQDYERLIYEDDFACLFTHHVEKTRKELLERMVPYYNNAEQKSQELTIEHLLQQILIENISESNKECWLQQNCFSILKAFDTLVKRIQDAVSSIPVKDLFQNEFISTNAMHLRKLIIDAKEFLMYLEECKGDTPTQRIGLNRGVNGFDSNWFAGLLFNGIVDTSNFAFFINLAFLLRDSLELRIRNGLGIKEIYNSDGRPLKVTNSDFVDFLFENDNISIPSLNKAVVKKIFDWSNYHIHKGIVLYEWQLVLCYDYVQPLFRCGEASSQISIHGAIQIQKTYYGAALVSDMKQFLIEKNPKNENIQITLQKSPEAMLV